MVDIKKLKGKYEATSNEIEKRKIIEKGLQYGESWFPIVEAHYVISKNALGVNSDILCDNVLDIGSNETIGTNGDLKIVYFPHSEINIKDRLEWYYQNTDRYSVEVTYKTDGIPTETKIESVVLPINKTQLLEELEKGYAKKIPITELYPSAKEIDERLLKVCDGVPYIQVYKTEDRGSDSHIYWVEITGKNGTGKKSDLWTLVQAGEHTREMITTDIAINWIEEMTKKQPIKNVIVIPMACVNRDVCREKDPCQRNYPNGVDPNRNWDLPEGIKLPTDFSNCSSCQSYVNSTKYGYATTLNNRLLTYIGGKYLIETYVNVHSGEFAIYSGLDSTNFELPNHQIGQDFIKELSRDCPECKVGDPSKISYKVYGSSVDHFLTVFGVKYAFTFEVYGGNMDLHGNDIGCYEMFNPTTRFNFDFQVARWTRILHNIVNSTYHWKD